MNYGLCLDRLQTIQALDILNPGVEMALGGKFVLENIFYLLPITKKNKYIEKYI